MKKDLDITNRKTDELSLNHKLDFQQAVGAYETVSGVSKKVLYLKPGNSDISNSGDSKFIFPDLLMLIQYLFNLSTILKNYDLVHILYRTPASFYIHIIPVILLSRFFSKKIVIDYRCPEKFIELSERNIIIKKFLKYCNLVVIISEYQRHLLNRYNINNQVMTESVNLSEVTHNRINSIQPGILIKAGSERCYNNNAVIKAYKLVKQKYPRCELVIDCDHRYKNYFQNFIKHENLPGITVIDSAEKTNVYQDTDLFVNSLRIDFLPKQALLAMGSGMPVISSPLSSSYEFINRTNIMFFKFNDHVSLADNIIELIENNNLVKTLSENGRVNAAKFDDSKLVSQWKKLYASL